MSLLLEGVRPAPGVKVQAAQQAFVSDAIVDILIDDSGNIVQVGAGPRSSLSLECPSLDCSGLMISPGWTDLHTHIYTGGSDFSLSPELIGPTTGVLNLVDAGSAGEGNFSGLVRYVIEPAEFPILASLNIGSIGLVAANRVSEVAFPTSIHVQETIECARRYSDYICAIKVRSCGEVVGEAGITPLRQAREVADVLGLPLIVHIGLAEPTLPEILSLLRPGDMVTHIFHGKENNTFLHYGKEVQAALARGIWIDVGHGVASFSYRVARQAIEAGIYPHTISTDLHGWSVDGPVWDLPTTMSKLLALGMPLESVIAAVTVKPAEFLRRPNWGQIQVGAKARLTVFELVERIGTDGAGGIVIADSLGDGLSISRFFQPRYTIYGTKWWQASSRFLRELEQ